MGEKRDMKSTALKAPALLALCLVALQGCLGTQAKTLGTKSVTTGNGGAGDVESFSITLAYRSGTSRIVTLQGVRDLASAKLSNSCGTNGRGCQCLFYKTTLDTAPVASADEGLSDGVNSYSCTITGSVDPATYKYVRLRTKSGVSSTGFINIKASLTITDVLGDLNKDKVRGIYRYTCNRFYLEGEGVTVLGGETNVECKANQRLGLISAPYNFYLYDSKTATNEQEASIMGQKGSGSVMEGGICRKQLAKTSCTTSPSLRYGLYGERTGPFQVGIAMTTKPDAAKEDDVVSQTMGFAALPDSAGNCPTGLVKIQPWMAQPQSIIAKSINNSNPPSSFLNNNNVLDEKIVEEAQPSPMLVSRQPNSTPCNGTSTDQNNPTGNCENVSFGGLSVVQSITFSKISPVVCAIPADLLSGVIP
jgi:hypothetical protein